MNWQEIRERYPQQWLLLEAIKARTKANHRILDQLAVLGAFPNSGVALQKYTDLHRTEPERELYVFHTSRATLDVTERRWLGLQISEIRG